jgi:hypothetical protein
VEKYAMGNKRALPTGAEIGIYATDDPASEPYRRNLPEENWLAALCIKALTACRAALRAHRQAEGEDCDCDLLMDMRGLEFNLELSESGINGQLVQEDSIDALGPVINRLTHLVPARNLPEEDCLLRTLELLLAACDIVEQRHNAAVPDGRCYCNLCLDVFGLRYNARTAHDLISGMLWSIDTPEEVLTCLINDRERQRAKDGPGCPCFFCTMAMETLRALAEASGHRAAPPEAEAQAPVAIIGEGKPFQSADNTSGHHTQADEAEEPEPGGDGLAMVVATVVVQAAVKPSVPSAPHWRNYWEPADI